MIQSSPTLRPRRRPRERLLRDGKGPGSANLSAESSGRIASGLATPKPGRPQHGAASTQTAESRAASFSASPSGLPSYSRWHVPTEKPSGYIKCLHAVPDHLLRHTRVEQLPGLPRATALAYDDLLLVDPLLSICANQGRPVGWLNRVRTLRGNCGSGIRVHSCESTHV